jgi:antitoxin CcdA
MRYVSTVAKLYVDQQVPLRRIPASDWPGAGGESALRKWTSQPPASTRIPQSMTSPQRAKKAVNVSISADVLEAARSHEINLSATLESALEDQLRQRRRKEWLVTNGDSIEAYNRDVEKRGTFGDSLRSF